jgi:PKD repeat protein
VTTSVNWGDSNYGYTSAAAPQTTYQQGQSTLTFTHTYQYAGTYNVTFTVTGSNGQSNTASATVIVSGNSSSNITLSAYPSTGNAPLYTTFSMYLAGCSGGNYYLNYGDGTSEFVAIPADSCNHTLTRSHTYTTNGTYQAQLRNSTQTLVLANTTVTVGGGSSTGYITASPSYGMKPLNVIFSANPGGASYNGGVTVLFGDGSAGTLCTPNEACTSRVTSHVYTTAGTYYVNVQGSNNGSTTNLGTATVIVYN